MDHNTDLAKQFIYLDCCPLRFTLAKIGHALKTHIAFSQVDFFISNAERFQIIPTILANL